MSVWLCKVRSYELCVCSSRAMCSPRRLCELLHVKCVNSSSRVSDLDFLQINTSMLHYFRFFFKYQKLHKCQKLNLGVFKSFNLHHLFQATCRVTTPSWTRSPCSQRCQSEQCLDHRESRVGEAPLVLRESKVHPGGQAFPVLTARTGNQARGVRHKAVLMAKIRVCWH